MTRTRRNIPHERWFRNPKTYSYRRDLIACEEEIRSELGPNYLAGNFAKINTIPTDRDDMYIEGRFEDTPINFKYSNLYYTTILGASSENDTWTTEHSVEFDAQKNVFRAWRCQSARNLKVNYVPFIVTIAKKQYPVKIKIDWWYD